MAGSAQPQDASFGELTTRAGDLFSRVQQLKEHL